MQKHIGWNKFLDQNNNLKWNPYSPCNWPKPKGDEQGGEEEASGLLKHLGTSPPCHAAGDRGRPPPCRPRARPARRPRAAPRRPRAGATHHCPGGERERERERERDLGEAAWGREREILGKKNCHLIHLFPFHFPILPHHPTHSKVAQILATSCPLANLGH